VKTSTFYSSNVFKITSLGGDMHSHERLLVIVGVFSSSDRNRQFAKVQISKLSFSINTPYSTLVQI